MLSSRRMILAVLVVTATLTVGCTAPARWFSGGDNTAEPQLGPSPLASWRSCPEVASSYIGRTPKDVRFDCATIEVPRDWSTLTSSASPTSTDAGSARATGSAAPGGAKTFTIQLLRARSTVQRNRIGSLLVNPGGPGGSGLQLAAYLAQGLPAEVTRRFDIVGFDPRGVGRSTPVKCMSNLDLDASFGATPDPVSDYDFNRAVSVAKRLADSCHEKYGDQLKLFSTAQAARDMDAVRAAVGDEKTTYLGYSYGTLLGATYAQLFPTRVRALVLDGAVDPKASSIEASEGQAKGFERAFTNFDSWCRNNASKCAIAPNARSEVLSALRRGASTPVKDKTDGRNATDGWIFTAIVSSLYSEAAWPKLATALNRLRHDDPSPLFALADEYADRDHGQYSNLFDANSAVNCADDGSGITVPRVRELQTQWRAKYPLFGASLAIGMLNCAQWLGGRDPYPTGPAVGAPPIVVVGTTGDPATPYEQTAKLASMLGNGVVLTWQGEGHTAYPQTNCVSDAVNRYLIDLRVPPTGLTCPARSGTPT